MEQTNTNKYKVRLNKWAAKLNKHKTQLNKLRSQLEKKRMLFYIHYSKLYDIRANIIKVRNELYSYKTEDVKRKWILCDELRELIYNEYTQCQEHRMSIDKYHSHNSKIDECQKEIDILDSKMMEFTFLHFEHIY